MFGRRSKEVILAELELSEALGREVRPRGLTDFVGLW